MNGKPSVFEARSEIPNIQEDTIPFLKIYKNDIFTTKKKMSFLEAIMKKSKEGTWSTSSLIPHREDIIPSWIQLLTPLC